MTKLFSYCYNSRIVSNYLLIQSVTIFKVRLLDCCTANTPFIVLTRMAKLDFLPHKLKSLSQQRQE